MKGTLLDLILDSLLFSCYNNISIPRISLSKNKDHFMKRFWENLSNKYFFYY